MAVNFPNTTDKLAVTGISVDTSTKGIAFGFWLRAATVGVARTYFALTNGTKKVSITATASSDLILVCTNNAGTTLDTSATIIPLTASTWYYVSVLYVQSTSTFTLYLDTVSKATVVLSQASTTLTTLTLGPNSSGTGFDMSSCRLFVNTAAAAPITTAQMATERKSSTAVNLFNTIYADYPLAGFYRAVSTNTISFPDASGNARDLTSTGGATLIAGPPLTSWQLHRVDLGVRQEGRI